MNFFEAVRQNSLEIVCNRTFRESLPFCRVRERLRKDPTLEGLYSLGGSMREIFTADFRPSESRYGAKSDGSRAGQLWQDLCVWYLNAMSCGTKTVVIPKKNKGLLPAEILSAFTVYSGEEEVRSITDPIAISIPSTSRIPEFRSSFEYDELVPEFRSFLMRHSSELRITILLHQTNCSDMIQIPMLLDLVRSKDFHHPQVEVGIGNWTPSSFSVVRTAYITAPTGGKHLEWGSDTVQPRRARSFSGGAYWGLPSDEDLGFHSLDRIFNRQTMLALRENVGQGFIEGLADPDFRRLFGLW